VYAYGFSGGRVEFDRTGPNAPDVAARQLVETAARQVLADIRALLPDATAVHREWAKLLVPGPLARRVYEFGESLTDMRGRAIELESLLNRTNASTTEQISRQLEDLTRSLRNDAAALRTARSQLSVVVAQQLEAERLSLEQRRVQEAAERQRETDARRQQEAMLHQRQQAELARRRSEQARIMSEAQARVAESQRRADAITSAIGQVGDMILRRMEENRIREELTRARREA
jgi:hypothetical protein